ncbi:MAG: gluconate 2-dehydrogenase subunit 3 family protein, partial [Pseudomonadota bacterium]
MKKDPSGRRRFLGMLVALSAVVPAGVLLAAPVEKSGRRISTRALGPCLDTLLPADATPGATQLGVDKALMAQARKHARIARLVALGCAWLDKQAREMGGEEFAALDEAARETVVGLAEQAPPNSLAREFFLSVQHQAFTHYYAQPAA